MTSSWLGGKLSCYSVERRNFN